MIKPAQLCTRFEQAEKKLNGQKQQREQMRNNAIAIGGAV